MNSSTEFRTLEEMTTEELDFEREQHWTIVRSELSWWIYRNGTPFMHVPKGGEEAARTKLANYGLKCADVDLRQPQWTPERWRRSRFDMADGLAGRKWRIRARHLWYWLFFKDAA